MFYFITELESVDERWEQYHEDPEKTAALLEKLDLLDVDDHTWLNHYLRLIRETEAALHSAPLRWARATGEGRPSLHPLVGSDSGTEWPWRAARRAVFIQCRTALRLSRDHACSKGIEFRSAAVEDHYGVSPEEIDILVFLLHHTLSDRTFPERRDILRFIANEEGDIVRKLPLIDEGVLVLADLINTKEAHLLPTNVLTADGLRATSPNGRPFSTSSERESIRPDDDERAEAEESKGSELGAVSKPSVSLDDVVLPVNGGASIGVDQSPRGSTAIAMSGSRSPSRTSCASRSLRAAGGRSALCGRGQATILLLHGPPGRGNTLAAEAIAHEFGRPLLSADWSTMGSAYRWTTENNMGELFRSAEETGAVLLMDEVDTLNKRGDTIYSGQQHINRLVNLLLTKLEAASEGAVIIMASNRADALDPAIDRRLTMKLEFLPAETEEQRARLWETHLRDLPLEGEVQKICSSLARSYPELDHGGHIKQAVMTAARRAITVDAADRLPLETLQVAADDIVDQLDLKEKRRMGFRS